ncbi:MAG: VOC family protein [Pseudomonadota bacterium]|uniref:VOC domain-containing protein n=1 Tax=marine metagenome TaxID=408172 RepID=A0A382XS00_9ZZZZ|nr:VOC family protein [Pseudomonadota bacterium]
MTVIEAIPQIRTTNIEESIDFYVDKLGFDLDFRKGDFYAGIKAGNSRIHLKLADEKDPSITFVKQGNHVHLYFFARDTPAIARQLKTKGVSLLSEPHDTDYSKNEFKLEDNQGHILYFSETLGD